MQHHGRYHWSGWTCTEDYKGCSRAGIEPEIIKKRAVVEEGLESQVISMYAKGMTVRDIAAHLQALYGIELSTASISNITDKVSDEAKEWYSRTLESFYPVVFLDAIRTIFPETRIQLCIIHQIRNTLKYVAYKDQKAFMRDLKRVYGAESEEIAMQNLERMMDDWKQ